MLTAQDIGLARLAEVSLVDSHRSRADPVLLSAKGEGLLTLTSGTTGPPKMALLGDADLQRTAELCSRFCGMERLRPHSSVMILLPMGLWSVGKITAQGHVTYGNHVFQFDLHGGPDAWNRWMNYSQASVLSSTPSVLLEWAPRYDGPAVGIIETTGERLTAEDRTAIEQAFGGEVFDAYGLSECVVGVECSQHDGFHFWPDAVFLETLDPQTDTPVPAGVNGEITITSLLHAGRPLIRMRTGDSGTLEDSPCLCGSTVPRVRVGARLVDTIALTRGVKIDRAAVEQLVSGTVVFDARRNQFGDGRGSRPAVPTLTVQTTVPPGERSRLRKDLDQAFPELAELVAEGDVLIRFCDADD